VRSLPAVSALAQTPSGSRTERAERFLTLPMAVGWAVYGLFALTFSAFQVRGDGLLYFNLLKGFFGEKTDFTPYAYQFGVDIWNAPFFLVGKALGAIFGAEPRVFHVSFEEIGITVAAQVAFVLTMYLGWRLLRELDLPRGPGVLFLTVFGSPLFYYVIFDPAAKHAVDTLVITAATYLLARSARGWTTRNLVALGALAGLAANIRYVDVAFFLVLACFAYRAASRRAFGLSVATAVVVGGVIFVLPALRGIGYIKLPHFLHLAAGSHREASSNHMFIGSLPHANPLRDFNLTIPLKMLFSEHRGLFLWTPLTAFAVAGFILTAVSRYRAGRDRSFFVPFAGAALALLLVHLIWHAWDGGFAFSQRFLTGLFPLYLIGVAELVRRARAATYIVLSVCVAFSLAVALVHNVGYDNVSEKDGVSRVVHEAITAHHDVRIKVQERVKKRWRYLAGLTHGIDSEHVHGP
jgi:hypothetical protein